MALAIWLIFLIYSLFRLKVGLINSIVWSLLSTSSLAYVLLILGFSIDSLVLPFFALIAVGLLDTFLKKRSWFNQNVAVFTASKRDFLLLVPILALVIAVPQKFQFLAWDELSAWAHRSKFVFLTRSLWREGELEFFPFYPPILHTLHQTFLFGGSFDESMVMRTHLLLVLSSVAALIPNDKKRSDTIALVSFSCIIFSLYFFGFNMYSVVPDLMLSTIFALGLRIVLNFEGQRANQIMLLPVIFFMVLLKPTGVFFAFALLVLFFMRHGIRLLKPLILISIVSASSFASWQIYIFANGLNTSNFTPVGYLAEIWNDFFGKSDNSTKSLNLLGVNNEASFQIIRSMVSDFYDGSVYFFLPLLLVALFTLLICRPSKKMWLFAALTFLAHELMLFFTYSNLMSGYEAENTASHSRYLATLLYPLSVIAFIEIIHRLSKVLLYLGSFLLMSIAMTLTINPVKEVMLGQPFRDGLPIRMAMEALAATVKVPSQSSIHFVEQNAPSLGYSRLLFAYSALPNRTSLGCWSWGKPYYESDIWTCSPVGLESYLQTYDFIFIEYADEFFYEALESFGVNVSSMPKKAVFKVVREVNHELSLKLLFEYGEKTN